MLFFSASEILLGSKPVIFILPSAVVVDEDTVDSRLLMSSEENPSI